MNVEAFLLCDAATDQHGKLNVLGAFDNIFFKQMPARQPSCSVATRIRFDKIEEGLHSFRIHIINQDGVNIGPKLEGKIDTRPAPNLDSVVTNVILNIQGLEFKQKGKYRIDLAVDGQIQASLPLWVSQVPEQP
ncbi:MAG: hypothetical protein L0Y36_05715 [Planctomycetales bacterium]|nr:hypothetical protein [Planctomycetales bacterium]